MKNFNKLIIFISILALGLLNACSNSEDLTKYIPSDAALVTIVDVPSIGVKGNFLNQKYTSLTELENLSKDNESLSILLKGFFNSENSMGIDVMQSIFQFATYKNTAFYNVILVSLDDAEAFSNSLEDYLSSDYTIQKSELYTAYTNEKDSWICYNDDVAMFVNVVHANSTSTVEFINGLFTNTENSIAQNESYSSFAKNASDISVWISVEKGLSILEEIDSTAFSNLTFINGLSLENAKNTYYVLNLTFEEDMVEFKAEMIPGENFQKFIDENALFADKISDGFLDVLPAETYLLSAVSLDPQKVKTYFKSYDEYSDYEKFALEQGITFDKLFDSFKGDISVSLHGVTSEMVTKTDMTYEQNAVTGVYELQEEKYTEKELIPRINLMVSVNDNTILDIILKEIFDESMYEKQGEYYKIPNVLLGYSLYVGQFDNALMISTDKLSLDALFQNSNEESFTTLDNQEEIEAGGFYTYLNLDKDTYSKEMSEFISDFGFSTEKYNSIFKSVSMSVESNYSLTLTLLMKDNTENSLTQILKFFDNTEKPAL